MDTLVVGVADTEGARDALLYARIFADATEAELHVVGVHSDTIFYEGAAEMKAARELYFERMLSITTEVVGPEFRFHEITETSVPKGLTEIAEKLDAGAIVIGSSHRGPVGRVLIGDEGSRLVTASPCPVIITPRGWRKAGSERIRRVGIAYQGTPEGETALEFGGDLAKTLGASVFVIGVIPKVIGAGRIGYTDHAYEEILRQDMETLLADAIERLGSSDAEGRVRCGETADELTEASLELDLLILGSRSYGPVKRVLLGGTSVRMMRSSACPVLVVPKREQ